MQPILTRNRARRPRARLSALAVLLALGACAPTLSWQPMEAPKQPQVEAVDFRHSVHFETDRAVITAPEEARLRAFLDSLGQPGRATVRIEGHADERATDLYNMDLSARRAERVAAFLEAYGYPRPTLHTVAYGEMVPVAPGSTDEAWRQNRRAEIIVRRHVATVPGCPDWSKPSGFDPYNMGMSNFGCATASNLARMVADPADLAHGRELGPADGVREADAFRRYRDGNVTPLRQERR